eukprot:gene10561-3891_t
MAEQIIAELGGGFELVKRQKSSSDKRSKREINKIAAELAKQMMKQAQNKQKQ